MAIVLLVTLVAFEALAVSTAMPVLAADLHAVRDYGLAFSVFLTTSLLGVVVSGTWCDASGAGWPIRIGLACFGGGLLVCGFAPDFAVLLAGRAVSGAGGGLLVVALYVVIADVYPGPAQPRVFSLVSAGWVLPGLVGPVLAGWLAENVSWRAVFLLVPPLAVPAALALLPRLRGGVRAAVTGGRVRVVAGVALAGGVLAIQWALGEVVRPVGPRPVVAALMGIAGVVAAGLGFYRLTPAGTLRLRRGLPVVVVMRGLYAATFFGVEAFIPLMLVTERGMSALEAGLVLTGGTLGWTAGSFAQARPRLRVPRHLLLAGGAAVIGAGELLLVLAVRPPVPGWSAFGFWAVTALGMGLGTASTSVLVLRYSDPGTEGRNSAALTLSDSLGGALGIAVAGSVFAARHVPGHDAGLFSAMWVAFGALALLAGAIALRARALVAAT